MAGKAAVAGLVATLLCVAGTLALFLAGVDADRPAATWGWRGTSVVVPTISALVGAVVARRRPENAVGWVFLGSGLVLGLTAVADEWATNSLRNGVDLPGGDYAAWFISWSWIVAMTTLGVHAMLLFPDGHYLSSRWRVVGVTGIAAGGGTALVIALRDAPTQGFGTPNPFGVLALSADASDSLLGLLVPFLLLAQVALWLRLRRSRGDEREQVRWVLFAVFLLALVMALNLASPVWTPGSGSVVTKLGETLVFAALAAIPLAAGIAILRFRLYDIDIVISRAVVVAGLTAFVTAVYGAIVVGAGTFVGGGRPGGALPIAATAVVAVAFQPVRERLRVIAARLVYGERRSPYQVLADVATQAARTTDASAVLEQLARGLAEATIAARATVWLQVHDELRPAASWPADLAAAASAPVSDIGEIAASCVAPVTHEEELLGAITLQARRGETLPEVDVRLALDVAAQAGLVLRNLRLTAELLQRVEELRLSRQRLVAAQDEERRRIERDLHDGAQQLLVAVRVQAGLAKTVARQEEAAKTESLLDELSTTVGDALETLRDLARGIYPPLLAAEGLVAALKGQATKNPLSVAVAGTVERHPKEVEAAVYFCCLEALQNAGKYAGATNVEITLAESDSQLVFRVSDDGSGFDVATTPSGAGLTNMRDRIDAIGGTLTVSSSVGTGTCVEGRVPIPST